MYKVTKLEMHRKTPNWTWTLDSQKYPVYVTYPWAPNFGPFRSTDSGFEEVAHFIIPHWLPC